MAAVAEPGTMEIFVTVIIGRLAGSMYGDYVRSIRLKGNERVLDFGSGSGNPATYLAPILERGGGELVCMDISARWQDVCRKRLQSHSNVSFRLGRLEDLGFPDGSFDVVFSHFALHELPADEQQSTLRHFARILRLGGKVFLREPAQFLDPRAAGERLEQAGFRPVSEKTLRIRSQGEVWEAVYEKA